MMKIIYKIGRLAQFFGCILIYGLLGLTMLLWSCFRIDDDLRREDVRIG